MPRVAVVRTSPLAVLVDDYLAACRARGLSRNTVDNSYGYPLRTLLLPFCEEQGMQEVSELSNRLLDRFTGRLLE